MYDAVIVERIKDPSHPFYRPPLPQQESLGIYPGILTLMKQCWAEEPSERPSFVDVAKSLKMANKGKSVSFFIVLFRVKFKTILILAHFYSQLQHKFVINFLWYFT